MNPSNENKPNHDVIATYKCQRQTGKMKLVRTEIYMEKKRKFGGGTKLEPLPSDEDGEDSNVPDLGKTKVGSIVKGTVADVVKNEYADSPVPVEHSERVEEEAGDKNLVPQKAADAVSGKKRGRSGSFKDDDDAVEGEYNPSNFGSN